MQSTGSVSRRCRTVYLVKRPLQTGLDGLAPTTQFAQDVVDVRRVQFLSRDEVVSEAQTLAHQWETLSMEDRRAIVETITRRIPRGDEEVGIEWEYLPPFDGAGTTWQRTSAREIHHRFLR